MLEERLQKQLDFLVEIDKMKSILRQTLLIDRSRRENDAEHSWHIAVMAIILQEHVAEDAVDIAHVVKMTLIHDLIEVYAGDTFAYDDEALANKEQRELEAADQIFSMLPQDQGAQMRTLWDEFEAKETKESRFANAVDRLQPFMNNHHTDGHTWRFGTVSTSKVYKRMDVVREVIPAMWPYVEEVIADAVNKGFLIAD